MFCLQGSTDNLISAQLEREARKLQHLEWSQTPENSTQDAGACTSLETAKFRGIVCLSALVHTPGTLPSAIDLSSESGSDAVIGALRCIPEAFRSSKRGLIKCLVDVYCRTIRGSFSQEVQKAALEALCELLEDRFTAPYSGEMEAITAVLGLKPRAEDVISSPAISNLWTSLSGWMAVFEIIQQKIKGAEDFERVIDIAVELKVWSRVWILLGKDNQVSSIESKCLFFVNNTGLRHPLRCRLCCFDLLRPSSPLLQVSGR